MRISLNCVRWRLISSKIAKLGWGQHSKCLRARTIGMRQQCYRTESRSCWIGLTIPWIMKVNSKQLMKAEELMLLILLAFSQLVPWLFQKPSCQPHTLAGWEQSHIASQPSKTDDVLPLLRCSSFWCSFKHFALPSLTTKCVSATKNDKMLMEPGPRLDG